MIKSSLWHLATLLVVPFYITPEISVEKITELKRQNALSCAPYRSAADDQEIFLLPGSGNHKWDIATVSDSAQHYFDQGINTYYGFHIIESIASFKKALKFDSTNHMLWWALALAYGPNINDVGYSASPEALAAVKNALQYATDASDLEKSLIRAMEVRYSADSTQERAKLNNDYTQAMKKAHEAHPASAEAMALYADAMMLEHPWDLWEVSGTPKPWTPAIRAVLEKGLAVSPAHPGLNHYYIHVMEPSPQPSLALQSADRLGSITPGLAHLVHMPSHIYLRTGEFKKGISVNQEALKQFEKYYSLFPAVASGAFIYELHNRHMLVNCAMHAGDYKTSIEAANRLQLSIDSATLFTPAPMGSLIQYVYMTPVLIHTRFAEWDSLLVMPRPHSDLVYANILFEFGQGMAKSGKNRTAEARHHVERIDDLMKDTSLGLPMLPFSSAIEGAKTARELLVGTIHLQEKQYAKAINHLGRAAEIELAMVYNEPRDWFLNPHAYLGEAYLKSGDRKKAEQAFRKDLSINEKNVWSMEGLRKMGKRE